MTQSMDSAPKYLIRDNEDGQVGYTDMDRRLVPQIIATSRKQIAKHPETADQFRAVLRACASVLNKARPVIRSPRADSC
jgi:hypothetical protein